MIFGLESERRTPAFQEWVSRFMVRVAAVGAIYVLVDPKLTCAGWDACALIMNSGGFSNDLKGLVIGAILIEGYKGVKEFWLGTSKGGQESAQSMSRIAEAAPAVAAAAVAAATPAPAKAETVNVDATGGDINITSQEPKS